MALLNLLGLIAIVYAFASSLKPSARAKSNVPSFALDFVRIGEFRWIDDMTTPARIFIVRTDEARFSIFRMGFDSRSRTYWNGPPYIQCRDIIVVAQEDEVRCEWPNEPPLRWNLQGKASVPWAPDLQIEPFSIDGGVVRFGHGA